MASKKNKEQVDLKISSRWATCFPHARLCKSNYQFSCLLLKLYNLFAPPRHNAHSNMYIYCLSKRSPVRFDNFGRPIPSPNTLVGVDGNPVSSPTTSNNALLGGC
ncbi:hypothetical protein Ac2012v2_006422 [Leucoagaricus gongylophorus]